MRKIGHKLKEWRRRNGMTQMEMAQALGISRSYVAAIESGYLPPVELVEKIAAMTGSTLAELLEDPDKQQNPEEEWTETPVLRQPTTRTAVNYARELLQKARLTESDLPPMLWEFLNTREAYFVRVKPDEALVLRSLRFQKGPSGSPSVEDYLNFLVMVLRPGLPRE
jgi:transcriptional regulator with XRE-family HTH domain